MKAKRLMSAAACILAVSMVLSSCGKTQQPLGEADRVTEAGVSIFDAKDKSKNVDAALKREDTIVIGTVEFNGVFSPFYVENQYDKNVVDMMYDNLFDIADDGSMVDGLATHKVSEDGKTITFTLKDVKYWDGTPVKAQDFVTSYKVFADKAYTGPSDYSLAQIKGWDDYYNGDATEIAGVVAKDDKTLEVTVDKAIGPTLEYINIFPTHPSVSYTKGDVSGAQAMSQNPIGTGAYKFVEYKEGESVTLVANDDYYKAAPKIKNVILSVTPTGKELQRVQLGEVDIDFPEASPENVQAGVDAGFIDQYVMSNNGYGYVGINNALSKFDQKTRQALLTALNRDDINEAVYGPYAFTINAPVSNVSWAYSEEGLNKYAYNLEEAAKLLEEAGWTKNSSGKLERDGETLDITFTGMPDHPVLEVMLPVMKQDYESLGITFNIEYTDFPSLVDKVNNHKAEMWFMAWGLTPDPDPKQTYHSEGAQNTYQYSNPETDKLIDEALEETDQKKRKELYKKVWQALNEDVPCMWIYQRCDAWAVNSRVKNLEMSPFRSLFTNLYKAELDNTKA